MYRFILTLFKSPIIRPALLAAIVYFLCINPSSTHASISPTLSISPAKFDLPIKAGETQELTILITNRSEAAIPLKAVAMDFAPRDTKGNIDFGKSLPNHSATTWFQIAQPSLTLQPGESKNVVVTVTPPLILDPGGFYAVVMFQADFPSSYFDSLDETQAKVIPWIGTLFLLRHGEAIPLDENALTIKRFSIPRFSVKENVPALIEVSNNTAYHLAPDAEFLVASLRGPVKAKIKTGETTILPGSSRIFEAEIMNAPILGLYQGKAVIRIASYQKSAVTWPLVLITFKGAIILTAILVALILIVFFRRRLLVASEVFIGLGRSYKQKIVAKRNERKKNVAKKSSDYPK